MQGSFDKNLYYVMNLETFSGEYLATGSASNMPLQIRRS